MCAGSDAARWVHVLLAPNKMAARALELGQRRWAPLLLKIACLGQATRQAHNTRPVVQGLSLIHISEPTRPY